MRPGQNKLTIYTSASSGQALDTNIGKQTQSQQVLLMKCLGTVTSEQCNTDPKASNTKNEKTRNGPSPKCPEPIEPMIVYNFDNQVGGTR
jgi:hypothetical protein